MVMVFMIWQVMLMNGAPIGMILIIIATRHYVILKVRVREAYIVLFGAVLGIEVQAICVCLNDPTNLLIICSATTDSVVSQMSKNSATISHLLTHRK